MNYKLKGSAIMWTICILAVSVIMIGGVLGIAEIYHKRTINETKKQQALYTAISAVSVISNDIQSENHQQWLEILWDSNMNMPSEKNKLIENLTFDNADMGTVNLLFEWNSNESNQFPYTMKLTVFSDYYNAQKSISADFEFNQNLEWKFIRYCE